MRLGDVWDCGPGAGIVGPSQLDADRGTRNTIRVGAGHAIRFSDDGRSWDVLDYARPDADPVAEEISDLLSGSGPFGTLRPIAAAVSAAIAIEEVLFPWIDAVLEFLGGQIRVDVLASRDWQMTPYRYHWHRGARGEWSFGYGIRR